jgi:hypothetical protein
MGGAARQSAAAVRLFLCHADLLFGLEPIVELRARLVATLQVEFVGSLPDLFFEGELLDSTFFARGSPRAESDWSPCNL